MCGQRLYIKPVSYYVLNHRLYTNRRRMYINRRDQYIKGRGGYFGGQEWKEGKILPFEAKKMRITSTWVRCII